MKSKPQKTDKEMAKYLNFKYRIWKYGIYILPRDPSGRIYKLIAFVPLRGWVSGREMIEEMRKRDFEL